MRKIVMYCDRCEKEFEKWNHKQIEVYGVAEFVHDDGNPYLDEAKDLCESCYIELENWWNCITPQQTDKVEKSNFNDEQYKADIQSSYDCGYNCGYTDAMNDITESEG